MQYALLFQQTPEEFAARSDPEAYAGFMAAFVPYVKALQEAGVVVAGAGLEPPGTATSLHMRDGKWQVQDGPFADSKEQLAGFFIIEVPNLDAALDWASRYPGGPGGGVEVRPVAPPKPQQ